MKTKEKLITGMAALAATSALTGLFFIRGNTEKARVTRAEEIQASAGFTMIEGASVRLNADDGLYGIRFGARVEDVNRAYSMMIVPTELAAGYDEKKDDGEALSVYCERIAHELGGSVAKAEGLMADSSGEISCALVQIRWENLNRSFFAMAYYEEDGARIEAKPAIDGNRSVSEVATKALESDNLNEMERAAVIRLQADGEKQANGIAVDAAMGETLFGLTEEANADGEWLCETTKTFTTETGEIQEAGWKIVGKETVDINLNAEVWCSRLKYEDGTASFTMCSEQAAQAVFYNDDRTNSKSIDLQADETKRIAVPTEELTAFTRLVITTDSTAGQGESEYFIGEITERTAEEAATEVIGSIAALPDEDEVKNAGESETQSYLKQIFAAEELYGGLSESGKLLTTNAEKLSALLALIRDMSEEEPTLLFDSADSGFAQFICQGDYTAWAGDISITRSADSDYGNTWKVKRNASELAYLKTEIKIMNSLVSDEKLAGYKEIAFYVYTQASAGEGEALKAALSEAKYVSYDTEEMKIPFTLINGAWVKITLTCEQFRLVKYFTAMFNVGTTGCLKISPFYGVK